MRKGEACLAPTLEFGANLGKSEACLAPTSYRVYKGATRVHSVARCSRQFDKSLPNSSNLTRMWHYRNVMSNTSWRGRLISNLSSWLVQEGPLEQVGCECCTELNCSSDNYRILRTSVERLSTRQVATTIGFAAAKHGPAHAACA